MTQADLLVIGAGPAGCAAALAGASAGLRVLLLEEKPFPRFRIGESLLPACNLTLQKLGVWPAIAAAGFIPKHGARFCLADGSAEKAVRFDAGIRRGPTSTFQVERADFDRILLDAARHRGVEVRQPARAEAVATSRDHAEVTWRHAGSPSTVTTSAGWVIDASGRAQVSGRAAAADLLPLPWPSRAAAYGHFSGIPRLEGRDAGDIRIVRLNSGWAWVIPLRDDRTSVGIVGPATAIRSSGGPEAFFSSAIAGSALLSRLLTRAERTSELHVTSDYSFFRTSWASGRLLRAGDAGGFYDPIFSSGVHLALSSGALAVETLLPAHRANRPLSPREAARFSRRISTYAGVFRRLIETFYSDAAFSVFFMDRPPLGTDRAITSIVAGYADLTFGQWWRFHLFLWACRRAERAATPPTGAPPAARLTPSRA